MVIKWSWERRFAGEGTAGEKWLPGEEPQWEWVAWVDGLACCVWRAPDGGWLWSVEVRGADLSWMVVHSHGVAHVAQQEAQQACEDALVSWLTSTALAVGCIVDDRRRAVLARQARRAREAETYARFKDSLHWEVTCQEYRMGTPTITYKVKHRDKIVTIVDSTASEEFYVTIESERGYCFCEGFSPTLELAQASAIHKVEELRNQPDGGAGRMAVARELATEHEVQQIITGKKTKRV